MKTSALKDGSEQALNGENKSSFLFFLQIDFPSFSSIFPTLHPAQCFISTSLGKTNSDIFFSKRHNCDDGGEQQTDKVAASSTLKVCYKRRG